MILLACSLAMLITVYTCGTAATGDKVRAWVTVLLLLALFILLLKQWSESRINRRKASAGEE